MLAEFQPSLRRLVKPLPVFGLGFEGNKRGANYQVVMFAQGAKKARVLFPDCSHLWTLRFQRPSLRRNRVRGVCPMPAPGLPGRQSCPTHPMAQSASAQLRRGTSAEGKRKTNTESDRAFLLSCLPLGLESQSR